MSMSSSSRTGPTVPRTLDEFIPPRKTALIMWDMQNGLAGHAINIDQIKRNASQLLKAADRAGVLVIWSRHVLPPFDLIVGPFLLYLMRRQGVERPEDLKPWMQEGSKEGQFLEGFTPSDHHLVIEKSLPSFFAGTPLDLRLRSKGIETLVLTGVATHIGIESTYRHAMVSGYYSVVVEDATGAYTQEAHDQSIEFMRAWTPVVSTAEICSVWGRTAY